MLVPAMMSSEESEDEVNINYVKDLPWCANIVKEFFSDLRQQNQPKQSVKESNAMCLCLSATSSTGNAKLGS